MTGIFQKLDVHFTKQKLRPTEFFGLLDKDGGGDIDIEELREGLSKVIEAEDIARGWVYVRVCISC